MRITTTIKAFIAIILYGTTIITAFASNNEITCKGNLETGDKQIIEAGVTYNLSSRV